MTRTITFLFAALQTVEILGFGKPGSEPTPTAPTAGATGNASSAETAKAVETRIKADKDLAGTQVGVREQNGTIALDGTVSSVSQKDKAEKIVMDTQKELKQQPG